MERAAPEAAAGVKGVDCCWGDVTPKYFVNIHADAKGKPPVLPSDNRALVPRLVTESILGSSCSHGPSCDESSGCRVSAMPAWRGAVGWGDSD